MPGEALPDLKTDPKYGYFPWWPEDGDDWVHPEDVATARSMIPSPRVWRRDGALPTRDGEFVVMHYGDVRIRVRRTLWKDAPHEGYDLGDTVEVRSYGMLNDPQTGVIREMWFNEDKGVVEYQLRLGDGTLWPKSYRAEELKQVEQPSAREEVQYEPVEDDGDELDLDQS